MDLVKIIYQPWTTRVGRRVLIGRLRVRDAPVNGRFTRRDVDRLVASAWQRYARNAPLLPSQPTLGSAMNVRLACFTLSMLDELLALGTPRSHAIELVADAAWGIYRAWGRIASTVAWLAPGKSGLGFAVSRGSDGAASLRFPFNAPGYLVQTVPAEHGTAFDVVRCPVARYFREHGAADLCVAAWCNLDYALGDMTHQKLVRTTTLAEGADRCDFRVLPVIHG